MPGPSDDAPDAPTGADGSPDITTTAPTGGPSSPAGGPRPAAPTGSQTSPRRRRRDPATMAALLVAAMPGTVPVTVGTAHPSGEDVDAAVVHDAEGGVWVVTAPRSPEAGARIDAETEAVRLLAGVLPFDVPRPRADVNLPEGGRAIVFPAPRGRPVDLVRLAAAPGVCRSVGRSLAALHDVTTAVVERAGVPVHDAGQVRRRRLDELDRAALTGQVPPVLLERWEAVLDDTGLWDFSPTVVHGDLVAERLVVTGEEVTAVMDWQDLHVGDPAEDLAWLAVGGEPETVDEVMHAYRASRHGAVDADLVRRAVLHGEMALVRWLLHGVAVGDDEVVQDAHGMLDQLAGWVEAENAARAQALAADRAEAEALAAELEAEAAAEAAAVQAAAARAAAVDAAQAAAREAEAAQAAELEAEAAAAQAAEEDDRAFEEDRAAPAPTATDTDDATTEVGFVHDDDHVGDDGIGRVDEQEERAEPTNGLLPTDDDDDGQDRPDEPDRTTDR